MQISRASRTAATNLRLPDAAAGSFAVPDARQRTEGGDARVVSSARRSRGRASRRSLAEATAERLLKLGRDVDAIAVVTVDHPRITEAIERLRAIRVPVVAVISDLTAPGRAGYVGLDNWKVGATAGWAMSKLCKRPGKIAVFVGNHRYLCQDMCEIRFRSYFRERAPNSRCSTRSRPSRKANTPTKARSTSCTTPPISSECSSRAAENPACCGTSRGRERAGEDRQRCRPRFDPRGAVRTPRRRRRRHPLTPDQVARRI